MTRKWTADWTLAHTEHSRRHTGPLHGAVKSRAAGLWSTQSYIWIYPGSIIRHRNCTMKHFGASQYQGCEQVQHPSDITFRHPYICFCLCTFVCTLTYKHVFPLARTAKSVSQEWAQGRCKGSRVRSRHIHTQKHTRLTSIIKTPLLTGLFTQQDKTSIPIYI